MKKTMAKEKEKEQEDYLGRLVSHCEVLLQDCEITRNYLRRVWQTTYDRQQYVITSRLLHRTLFGERFWDDVCDRISSHDEDDAGSMACEAGSSNNGRRLRGGLLGVGIVLQDVMWADLPSEGVSADDDDKEDKVYWEIVDYVAKYYKYDFQELQFTRRMMLHMGCDEQAEVLERLIERLLKRDIHVAGNYIEKQEIRNYGERK